MSSCTGRTIKLSIFGQSHGPAIGCTIDGLPAGYKIDINHLNQFLSRRKPFHDCISTQRHENDIPILLSGVLDDKTNFPITCGSPLTAIIRNKDIHPKDYENLYQVPRPGHADYTAGIKYNNHNDFIGGGHFSGRLTAALCLAGGIAKQILEQNNIYVLAHISNIGTINDENLNPLDLDEKQISQLSNNVLPTISSDASQAMLKLIDKIHRKKDSIGGTIECVVYGIPAGIGDPMFDGIENQLASAIFGIPAVKGIEFGSGFKGSKLLGSQNNDPIVPTFDQTSATFLSNNSGGILGGISTGAPIVLRAAFKPTPSIGLPQQTIHYTTNQQGKNIIESCTVKVKGRHDTCIVPRGVPVIEAVVAFSILDAIISDKPELLNQQ